MCGRFTQKYTWQELADLYRLNQTPRNIRPTYNICPTDPVGVLIPGANGLFLMPMRWGRLKSNNSSCRLYLLDAAD
jgi:putative SOS response-associated peptidase YedK